MKMIGVIAIATITFLCSFFSVSAKDGWAQPQEIIGTKWGYNEMIVDGRVAQCQIHALLSSSNKSSEAWVEFAILLSGSVVVVIEDSQLRKRINMDFGWKDGRRFNNILIAGEGFSARSSGEIWGKELVIRPADDQQVNVRSGLPKSKGFLITVGGLTFMAYETPGIAKAWRRLEKCLLYRR